MYNNCILFSVTTFALRKEFWNTGYSVTKLSKKKKCSAKNFCWKNMIFRNILTWWKTNNYVRKRYQQGVAIKKSLDTQSFIKLLVRFFGNRRQTFVVVHTGSPITNCIFWFANYEVKNCDILYFKSSFWNLSQAQFWWNNLQYYLLTPCI